MRVTAWVVLVSAVAAATDASVLEVTKPVVTVVNGRFHLEAVSEIAVPPDVAFKILTDYERLPCLNRRVLESRLLERPEPNVALVWMRLRVCGLCKKLEQVERVQENPPGEIVIEVLPERSDVKVDNAHWRIEPTESGTRLYYALDIEPAGALISFLGSGFIKKQLRESYEGALTNVERIGQGRMICER